MGALSVTDHPITGEIARSSGSCSTARKPATKSTPLVKPSGKLSFTGTLARPEGKLFGATPFSEPGSSASAIGYRYCLSGQYDPEQIDFVGLHHSGRW